MNKKRDNIICNSGFYFPYENSSKCIRCSVKNCDKCYGYINDNTCISCISPFIPFYENNKIIQCKYSYNNEEELEKEKPEKEENKKET